MALFQKQPIRHELVLPYTLSTSTSKTLLIVGLGNPGKTYSKTRHNLGFMVIDELANMLSLEAPKTNKGFAADISYGTAGSSKIILAKPNTYMNESGQSVRKIMDFYKIPVENLLVIHDELSIPFGQIRSRIGGQSAGHNGIKSVIAHASSAFGRIRIGIKNTQTPKDDTSDFVLAAFSKEEATHVETLVKEAALMASEYIYSGTLAHETRSILMN